MRCLRGTSGTKQASTICIFILDKVIVWLCFSTFMPSRLHQHILSHAPQSLAPVMTYVQAGECLRRGTCQQSGALAGRGARH